MAASNVLIGEMQIECGEYCFVLRPHISAFVAIEQRLGERIETLLGKWQQREIFASEAIVVAQCCVENSLPFHRKILCDGLKKIIPVFVADALAINEVQAGEEICDWGKMFAIAVCCFGVAPQDFWQMTVPEYRMLAEFSLCAENEISAEELTEMRQMLTLKMRQKQEGENDGV